MAEPPRDVAATGDERERWHPKLRQLYEYWRSIHPPEGLPGRQHFDPLAIPQLLSHLWLLDVQRNPFRLRYRLMGTGIAEQLGEDMTGQWLDESHPDLPPNYFVRYERVAEERVASWRRGRPLLKQSEHVAELENLILPLATNGYDVDKLLVVTVLYGENGRTL